MVTLPDTYHAYKSRKQLFLTCNYISYTSKVFSYCLCLGALLVVGPLGYTLNSLQVSLVHAWVSYPSPAAAAAVVVVVVSAAADVAAAAVLRAVVAEVEDLGIPHGVQLAVVVAV
jgi:hypothetical protein